MTDIFPPASGGRWHSKRRRREIGLVRVEIVEKHKKRARPLAGQPTQEGAVHLGGVLAAENLVTVYQATKPVGIDNHADEGRTEDELCRRDDGSFIVAKATAEATVLAAIGHIGDEPRGHIAALA